MTTPVSGLAALGPIVSRKRADRATRSLDVLAINDPLFSSTARLMIAHGCYTVPALDYIARKRQALRAAQFRQRYGRDYVTGARRHNRQRDAWWNEGYQDQVDGRPLYRKPDSWPRRRWVAYCMGHETAVSDSRA